MAFSGFGCTSSESRPCNPDHVEPTNMDLSINALQQSRDDLQDDVCKIYNLIETVEQKQYESQSGIRTKLDDVTVNINCVNTSINNIIETQADRFLDIDRCTQKIEKDSIGMAKLIQELYDRQAAFELQTKVNISTKNEKLQSQIIQLSREVMSKDCFILNLQKQIQILKSQILNTNNIEVVKYDYDKIKNKNKKLNSEFKRMYKLIKSIK